MRTLFDTHLVIWIGENAPRLPAGARAIYDDPLTEPVFSVVSLWEAAIKSARQRPGFDTDPADLRAGLLAANWRELTIAADHAIAVAALPLHHHDPFDRLLVAQAQVERMALVTADRVLAPYGPAVRVV
jgi:PIN domain nuclease of toxin-antitoxin system